MVVFAREYPAGMAGTKRIQHLLDFLVTRNISLFVIGFRSKLVQPANQGFHNSVEYRLIGKGLDMKPLYVHRVLGYYFRGFCLIASLKKKNHVNIVYNSGGVSVENIPFIAWAKILGYRLILAIEEDYSHFTDKIKKISKFKFWTVRKLDFLNCRFADAIVVISRYLFDKYISRKARHVLLIPITASPNYASDKKGFNNPLRVVYAGTFADKDGVDDIIEGFLAFNKVYKNAELILTGSSEQQKGYLLKYKDISSIIFKGFLPDNEFYELLKYADVLCMCRTESDFAKAGFPFKLGEYLATGNPVICTKVGDVPDYLTDDDAYLIKPSHRESITAALSNIVRNPEEARQKGFNGMKKCMKYFSPDSNGRLLLELLQSFAGETRKPVDEAGQFINK